MKKTIFLLAIITLFLLFIACDDEAEISQLSLGVSEIEVTPDLTTFPGTKPLGYFPIAGAKYAYDSLYAKAMVLNNGVNKVAWLVIDTCFIDKPVRDAVAEKVSDIISKDNILISAVHNHGGVGNVLSQPIFQSLFGEINEDLFDYFTDQLAQVIREANSQPVNVNLTTVISSLDEMNQSRRPFEDGGLIDHGTDKEITIFDFVDDSGNLVSSIVNFGCHPTIAPTHMELAFSSDWVGEFRGDAEAALDGDPLIVFINGVLGDSEPYYPTLTEREIQSWDKIDEFGTKFADATVPLIEQGISAESQSKIIVQTNSYVLPFPEVIAGTALMSGMLTASGVNEYDIEFMSLRLGDNIIVFPPGECTTPVGVNIKDTIKGESGLHAILAGPANDYTGYFPSQAQYEELASDDNYERQVCMFGPTTETIITDAVLQSARGLY